MRARNRDAKRRAHGSQRAMNRGLATPGSAETGIVVVGKGEDGQGYVLEDASLRASPSAWARAVVAVYNKYQANVIVAEDNNGGEMVAATLRVHDRTANVRTVHATRGKATRAEPVAALYEQARISHVGRLDELEAQLNGWDPTTDTKSPDRLDALVRELTRLGGSVQQTDDGLRIVWPEVASRAGVTLDWRGLGRLVSETRKVKRGAKIPISGGATVHRTATTFIVRNYGSTLPLY